MPVLDSIHGPDDLKALRAEQLPALAAEIRTFLVDSVSKTGGHLGPNLGVVELTIALHRVFDSPRDTIVFDTGHQSYVHKLLTGRHEEVPYLLRELVELRGVERLDVVGTVNGVEQRHVGPPGMRAEPVHCSSEWL